MEIMLSSNYDWAAMLTPVPLSVFLFGQLVLVSLDRGFSLVTDDTGRSQFKVTSNPQSLQESMMHLANEGWESFNCASKNMNAIRLLSKQVPIYIRDTVKVCFIIANL